MTRQTPPLLDDFTAMNPSIRAEGNTDTTMKTHIYADHAATTPLDVCASEAMLPWLLDGYGNPSQPYSFARGPKSALSRARETVAACIGADPEEVFFTSGGTESDNWVIKGSAFADSAKRETVASAFEHHAVLRSCEAIRRMGYPVTYVSPSRDGYVTPANLSGAVTGRTRLVCVMYANNELGTVQPVRKLCEIAHENGALFFTDAVQAVGHIPLNVHDLGVDFLSASAHKFNGPGGTGFLYIRKGSSLPPLIDGGGQENGYRAGTENVAGAVGLATALKNNCDAFEQNQRHLRLLEERLISGLKDNGVRFVRNGGRETLPGFLSLSLTGAEGETVLHRLDLMGISIATGAACDSQNTRISHVLRAIGLDETAAVATVRISFGKENTESDADEIARAISRVVGSRNLL